MSINFFNNSNGEGTNGSGHIIKNDISTFQQRENLKFKGNNFTVTDNETEDITEVEVNSDTFKTVEANGKQIVADGEDTLKIKAGEGFEISADETTKELMLMQKATLNATLDKNTYTLLAGEKATNTFQAKGLVSVIEPGGAVLKNVRTGQTGSTISLDAGDTWEYAASTDCDLIVLESEQRFGYRVEEKEWGLFKLDKSQSTGITENLPVKFNVWQGNIPINTKFTLKAGKTYKLEASIRATFNTSGHITYQFYDVTNNQILGIMGQVISANYPSKSAQQSLAQAVINVDANIEVELRILTQVNADEIISSMSFIYVEEIGVSGQIQDEYYYVPPGTVMFFAKDTPPPGWLECNGAELNRQVYKRLFESIRTTFGAGDGIKTFNIPDLRGEFIRGWDNGRGIDTDRGFGSWQRQTELATSYAGCLREVFNHDSYRTVTPASHPNYISTGYNQGNVYGIRPRNIALLPCIKY